jgi:hypothetical protein
MHGISIISYKKIKCIRWIHRISIIVIYKKNGSDGYMG